MCYTLHTHREEMRGGNKVGYAVVHMMKIKSGAVGGIQSHNNREHEPKTNPDVDMSRSEDNYDRAKRSVLKPLTIRPQIKFVKPMKRLKSIALSCLTYRINLTKRSRSYPWLRQQ